MHVHQEICIVILSSEASQEQNETKSAKEVLVDPSTTANLPSLHIQKNPKNICTGHTSPPGSPPKKTPQNTHPKIRGQKKPFGTNERLWDDFFGPLLKRWKLPLQASFVHSLPLAFVGSMVSLPRQAGMQAGSRADRLLTWGLYGAPIHGLIINGFHWELFHQKYKWSYFTISKRAFWWAARLVPWEC